MGKIVIPKNSASLDEVMGTMQIYYDVNDWLSNTDFIQLYKDRIGIIGDDKDSSAYTKKTEIGAYYGYLEWKDINNTQSPRRITLRGKAFVDHYNANDIESLHEDIMRSLEEVYFGRNNFACRSCDSDIEPPALFLRAMMDLEYLTNTEFAYLVYKMEYEGQHYTEIIREIRKLRSDKIAISIPDGARKFTDPKPILILERWGILVSRQNGRSKEVSISSSFFQKYKNRIRNLKIYNIDKDVIDTSISQESKEMIEEKSYDEKMALETNRLSSGENILLYGVPGSGKSWIIEHEYCKSNSIVERLLFYPDYTYSDFIGQILPVVSEDGQVSYKFTPGPFTNMLCKSYNHPQTEHILIIEEINRGNAPAIFGEVFQLLDRKVEIRDIGDDGYPIGTSEYGITNMNIAEEMYGKDRKADKVRIPSNLSIIGTMNTSDQNVFTLDTAFQRRWNMRLVENDFANVDSTLADAGILDTMVTWKKFCEEINKIIVGNGARMTSAEDKRLGAYFVRLRDLKFNDNMGDLKEYDSLRKKENKGLLTDGEKTQISTIREAIRQNRKFPEKVIKYLWDDAFKFNREVIFETTEYQSFEQVIRAFMYAKGLERFKVFKDNVRDAFSDTTEEE